MCEFPCKQVENNHLGFHLFSSFKIILSFGKSDLDSCSQSKAHAKGGLANHFLVCFHCIPENLGTLCIFNGQCWFFLSKEYLSVFVVVLLGNSL